MKFLHTSIPNSARSFCPIFSGWDMWDDADWICWCFCLQLKVEPKQLRERGDAECQKADVPTTPKGRETFGNMEMSLPKHCCQTAYDESSTNPYHKNIPLESIRIDAHQSNVAGASPTLVADQLPAVQAVGWDRSFLWGDSLVNLPEKNIDMHGTCMCVK